MAQGDNIMKPKRRILVVDDNYDVRNILSEYLLIQGFAVETAENGFEALEKFSGNHFDAVLTDFHMPRMDGLTLARQIRINDSQILIIIITSDIWMSAQKEGFVDYVVEKPFKLNEIYAILQGTLELKARNYA
jgi:CheY-like chemotaxis protein